MSISMLELSEKIDRLRADLAATNIALAATVTVLTPEQHQEVLQAMAQASVKKQAFFEKIPISEAKIREAEQLFRQAEDRIYQFLQAAPGHFGKS